MRQRPGEIFAESGTGIAGEGTGPFQTAGELTLTVCQTVRLESPFTTFRVGADQIEFAKIGHQYQAVAAPVSSYLFPYSDCSGVLHRRFHLDHAALRKLPLAWAALLNLFRRVEAEVGMPDALIGRLHDAEHLWLEDRADGIEQLRERSVARPFAGRAAGRANASEFGEVGLHRRRQLRVRCRRVRSGAQVHWQGLPSGATTVASFLLENRKLN